MVNSKEAYALIQDYVEKDEPVWLRGAPGIAKTAIVKELSKKLGMTLVIVNAAECEPSDLGLMHPDKETGTLRYYPPSWAKDCADAPRLLFFDELGQARPDMQNIVSKIAYERVVGHLKMHDGTRIIAASNDLSDGAAVNQTPTHLANRFTHIHVDPDADTFIEYAQGAGWWPMIAAFLKYQPGNVHRMPKDRSVYAWPSYRTWEKVNTMVGDGDEPERLTMLKKHAHFIIGDGVASEFNAFCKLTSMLDVDEMLENPTKAKIPEKEDVRYSLVGAIVSHVKKNPKKLTEPALELIYRFTGAKEYGALLIRGLYMDKEIHDVLVKSKKFDKIWDEYMPIIGS